MGKIRFCPRCRLQSAEALSIDCGCDFAEKERARSSAGSEQRISNPQVAGSNPAERASLIYRFFNGRWVDRLITQHRFESIASSPDGLRRARAYRRDVGQRHD